MRLAESMVANKIIQTVETKQNLKQKQTQNIDETTSSYTELEVAGCVLIDTTVLK